MIMPANARLEPSLAVDLCQRPAVHPSHVIVPSKYTRAAQRQEENHRNSSNSTIASCLHENVTRNSKCVDGDLMTPNAASSGLTSWRYPHHDHQHHASCFGLVTPCHRRRPDLSPRLHVTLHDAARHLRGCRVQPFRAGPTPASSTSGCPHWTHAATGLAPVPAAVAPPSEYDSLHNCAAQPHQ